VKGCTPAQTPADVTSMPLVDSLITAVVRSDGDALVLHVGEKPYVVAPGGPVELSRQGLGLGAMEGMLAQLLSADALRALREIGAVEHELDDRAAAAGDRFTVVAARGGDDIWIELRRHRRVAPVAPVVAPVTDATPPAAPEAPIALPVPDATVTTEVAAPVVGSDAQRPVAAVAPLDDPAPPAEPLPVPAPPSSAVSPPDAPEFAPVAAAPAGAAVAFEPDIIVPPFDGEPEAPASIDLPPAFETVLEPVVAFDITRLLEPVEIPADVPALPEPEPAFEPMDVMTTAPALFVVPDPLPPVLDEAEDDGGLPEPAVQAPAPSPSAPAVAAAPAAPPVSAPVPATAPPVADVTVAPAMPAAASTSTLLPPIVPVAPVTPPAPAPEPVPAMAQRVEAVPPRPAWSAPSRLDEGPGESAYFDPIPPQPELPGLAPDLHVAGRQAENARYDAPDALPAVVLSLTRDALRGNGGVSRGVSRPGGIERLLRLAAARGASALYLTTQARPAVRVDGDIRLLDGEPALSSGDVEAAVLELAPETRDKDSGEWIRDLQDVGRVRITTFRDYRGPGALLRMIQARATSAEQLGLVREIQALATEPEGLVIVTGPRASGKSTLLSAFVDLINRQRNDYVITLEGQIRLVHESRGSLISQRELRGNAGEVVSAARAALRENPDVLVIEDLRSADVLQVALDAAGLGLLVFVSITAASATAALERVVDLCQSEQRRTVRAAMAEHLRGVVAQVLLRKAGGGRLAARELVLNTSAVAALVRDGHIAQLPRAIDSGRKLGMAPLNDALVAFVQSGAVDVREAYRKADDKAGLLALLKREGIDTSFVERLA
jgi:twitching motility protein PilT